MRAIVGQNGALIINKYVIRPREFKVLVRTRFRKSYPGGFARRRARRRESIRFEFVSQ